MDQLGSNVIVKKEICQSNPNRTPLGDFYYLISGILERSR